MGPKKGKTPIPASDVLRDAKDAPLEGLDWIQGVIPSSPLPFNRTLRRPELRKVVPLANTTIYEMEQRGEFPPTLLSDVPMRRLGFGRGRGLD